MFIRADLTASFVRSVLDYNRKTGVFRWRKRMGCAAPGRVAGSVHKKTGRRLICINKHRYFASRLAWLYVTGAWPPFQVDHKNLNSADDRFSNLRPATQSQNQHNIRRPRHNTSGIKGVSWDKRRQKWRADIQVNSRQRTLGYSSSIRVATALYRTAAQELHGDFSRVA